MSATIGTNKLEIKNITVYVTIPDNNIARLMYYLNCIVDVIEYDDKIPIDYKNYDKLSNAECDMVVEVAKILNPSLFIKAGIFTLDPRLLLPGSNNEFYQITDETIGVHVNPEIVIAGKIRKVLKIMACNDIWLSTFYFNPLREIDNYGYRINTGITINSQVYRNSPVYTYCIHCNRKITTVTEAKCNFLACCCCLIFGVFYICFQACVEKNICCCDVYHRCPECGRILGKYSSC